MRRISRVSRVYRVARAGGSGGAAPAFVSAAYSRSLGTFIITLSEPCSGSVGFTPHASIHSLTLLFTEQIGNDLNYSDLSGTVTASDVLTLDYAPGDVVSIATGLPLTPFTGKSVANNA
jgi:hypothetical protein